MTIYKRTLRTYRFIDKDPIKDKLQTALQDAGLFSKKGLRQAAVLANLSYATLDNLFFGDTRRPQNATVDGLLSAIGYERVIRRVRTIKDLDAELAEARAWNKKEDARVAKLNARPPRKRAKRQKKGRPNLRLVA
jgi:hypothetical protein